MKKKPFSEIPYLSAERVTLRRLTREDAPAISEMTESEKVYRYLPTFLFEKKYKDAELVIERMYDECIKDSLILGVFTDGEFCGLAEMYGFIDDAHKISVGCRLVEKCWGRGIAGEVLKLMTGYLFTETDIEIITASSMTANRASAAVLSANGFILTGEGVPEDWGFEKPVPTDTWIMRLCDK